MRTQRRDEEQDLAKRGPGRGGHAREAAGGWEGGPAHVLKPDHGARRLVEENNEALFERRHSGVVFSLKEEEAQSIRDLTLFGELQLFLNKQTRSSWCWTPFACHPREP